MLSTKQTRVGLVQIGNKFGEQYYLPYSIGLLQAYAQKNLKRSEHFTFLVPIYRNIGVGKAVDYLFNANIVFFSIYIWNYRISLEIAKCIKLKKNDSIIVFGGPQIPEEPVALETLLRNNPFIDIACYGEGELPFLNILENIKERSWENVQSIGYMFGSEKFIYTPLNKRINKLDEIPSPYLENIFNPLIKANPEQSWAALLETNRGCPFSCSYCYWGKKSRIGLYQYNIKRVYSEIDWLSKNKIQFVFCCDANFGIFDRDIEIARKVAVNKQNTGYPEAFSVQNTKNATKKVFELQKTLNDSGLQKGVNLALQTINKRTLEYINRSNIDMKNYKKLQHMFTKNKIPTFSDIIIALPGESYDTFTEGVSNIIKNGQHNKIQFINLVILENSEMANLEYQHKYGMHTIKTKMIQHHTSLDNISEVCEMQYLVVETEAMPKEDWIKTRVFCWMTSLLYFNKLLQIPFAILTKVSSCNYKTLIELFMNISPEYKQISEILNIFVKKAKHILKGDGEYVPSIKWLNIWWPVDEFMFIKVCFEDKLDLFYEEAEKAINTNFLEKAIELPKNLLSDSIRLNKNLIKAPFCESDLTITLNYNLIEFFESILNGEDIVLKSGNFNYEIDRKRSKWHTWNDWLRDVVWYGGKKGSYLYDCKSSN